MSPSLNSQGCPLSLWLQVISEGLEQLLDAYVVVFAINDHDSFDTAHQLVRYLRVDYGTDRAILLVANKIDLVRKRKVTTEGTFLGDSRGRCLCCCC